MGAYLANRKIGKLVLLICISGTSKMLQKERNDWKQHCCTVKFILCLSNWNNSTDALLAAVMMIMVFTSLVHSLLCFWIFRCFKAFWHVSIIIYRHICNRHVHVCPLVTSCSLSHASVSLSTETGCICLVPWPLAWPQPSSITRQILLPPQLCGVQKGNSQIFIFNQPW